MPFRRARGILWYLIRRFFSELRVFRAKDVPPKGMCLVLLAGSAVQAFGLYHIHSVSGVTEGGVLGLTLLLYEHFGLSPAWTDVIFTLACYFIGFRSLGKSFLICSAISAVGFSGVYKLLERFPRLWPGLWAHPLSASLAGAAFIGLGAGFCVWAGGAPGGDDALAMSVSHSTGIAIEWVYLASDLIVLALSLTYIPLRRIAYSVLTVVLSGQIVGRIQHIPKPKSIRDYIAATGKP